MSILGAVTHADAGVMTSRGVTAIATFDRGFDRIEEITRVELD